MDRATLSLLGTAEYLAHLVKSRCRGRARRQALAALDQIKEDLFRSAAAHCEALNAARDLLNGTADSLRATLGEGINLPGQFDAVQELCVREVYPPPLPSSSSGGSPIRAMPGVATTRPKARKPRARRAS